MVCVIEYLRRQMTAATIITITIVTKIETITARMITAVIVDPALASSTTFLAKLTLIYNVK